MNTPPKIKGRGAQHNSGNRFLQQTTEISPEYSYEEEGSFRDKRTTYLVEHPKKVINEITSPDLPMGKSVNPYQGCEHGCIYCYARNTHEYFGYSAGLEFEQKIIVKKNAPELLEKELNKKSWKPTPILFSGNTDCYQPAEREFELTRQMLQVCLKYRNPVAIITKNALILRDQDILGEMAKLGLVKVIMSVTTLNENLRRVLEPRTASAIKRLQVLASLSKNGIPVGVNVAPIIPGLNDHEIPEIIKAAAEYGALSASYTIVRLNGSVGELFEEWIKVSFPNKADKVLKQIKELHGGTLNDSQFKRRMRGEGVYAEHIKQLFHIYRSRHFADKTMPPFNTSDFQRGGQLNLF